MQSMCLELTKNDVAASLEVDNDSIAVAAFHRGWPKARLSPLDNIIWSRPPSCRQAHSELCLWACGSRRRWLSRIFLFCSHPESAAVNGQFAAQKAPRWDVPLRMPLQPLFGGFPRRHLRSLCLKKLPDSLIAAAQCTNYSLVLPWHFKLKDKQIETL